MMAFRRYYFKDYWNLVDLFIVILSIIDIVIDLSVDQATGGFSPSILKVAKVFRVLRMGRVLRLFKVSGCLSLNKHRSRKHQISVY